MKSYNEMLMYKTFEERFKYLKCSGKIGDDTFGYDRWVNQKFYTSQQWRNFRNRIIVRDDGCDMALVNCKIPDNETITVHHINPMTVEDIINQNPMIFDENNVVCVRDSTHKALHYGDLSSLGIMLGLDGNRSQNDTSPWKILGKGENAVATKKAKKAMLDGIVHTGLLLNVRSTPEIRSDNIIGKLKDGSRVKIYDRKDQDSDFYKVDCSNLIDGAMTGYLMKKFVEIIPAEKKDDE